MTPNEREQLLAQMRDSLPQMWYAIYSGSLAAGFDQVQAFTLLQTWLLSQNPHGIRPPSGSGPDEKTD